MEIRTSFPKYQEFFTLIVQFKGKPHERTTTAKMYVGRYFTEKGEFDEVRRTGSNVWGSILLLHICQGLGVVFEC